MTQQPLFHEDIYEALKTIGQAFGGSKKIGHYLWPKLPIDKAGEKWANCLNRTRAEKLDPEEVLMILKIGRQLGTHSGMQFISDHCGYKYEPIEPVDEHAALLRDVKALAQELKGKFAKLEQLENLK
jgi:hypothetical protein